MTPDARATELHRRVCVLFDNWQGPPLKCGQILELVGGGNRKSVWNALNYLARKNRIRRVDRGIYEPMN